MAMHWFRRHQKHFLAGLVVLLMLSWGVLGTMSRIVNVQSSVGRIAGRKVSADDLNLARSRLQLQSRIWGGRPPTNEDAWRFLVLTTEARNAGITVTNDEVRDFVKQWVVMNTRGQDFSVANYDRLLGYLQVSPTQFEDFVRSMVMVRKLTNALGMSAYYTNRDLWARYRYENESARVKYVEIDPQALLPLVTVTDAEARAFYDAHKDQTADPEKGVVGYRDPKRVAFDVIVAEDKAFEAKAKIADEQVAKYYEEHKSEFQLPPEEKKPEPPKEEKPGEKKEAADQAAPAKAAEPAKEAAPAKAAGDDAKEKPAETASKEQEQEGPPAPRYKPLAEVKGVIEERLRKEAAHTLADAAVESVRDDIKQILMTEEDIQRFPLAELAKKHGLVFKTTGSLTREELAAWSPGGAQMEAAGFDKDARLYDSRKVSSPDYTMLYQLVGQTPSQVLPYEKVAARVQADVRYGKAVELARTYADQIMKAAASSDLSKAGMAVSDTLQAALKAARPAEAKPEAKEAQAPQAVRISETEPFSRPDLWGGRAPIKAMGGDRPKVAMAAFTLDKGQRTVVVDGKPEAKVYVIELVERTEPDSRKFVLQRPQQRMILNYRGQAEVVQMWEDDLMQQAKLRASLD